MLDCPRGHMRYTLSPREDMTFFASPRRNMSPCQAASNQSACKILFEYRISRFIRTCMKKKHIEERSYQKCKIEILDIGKSDIPVTCNTFK